MDEAEYCGRIGIMRAGHLLAIDSPSALKEKALPGIAWDVFAQPLLAGLETLKECPCVLRAGLVGDHLRAITPFEIEEVDLIEALASAGIQQAQVNRAEPSLEDVFLALAIDQNSDK